MTGVLVLRALGLGDLLVAVPALRGLRRAFPEERITLAAPPGLACLAQLTGAVDRLLPLSGAVRPPWQGAPPSLGVNLHGRGPESIAALLSTGARTLFTHRHPGFPALDGPQWTDEAPEAARWCALLGYHGVAADPDELALSRPALDSPAPGSVVVHPGAGFGACRWPWQRFADVARELAKTNRVVVTGSAGERDIAVTLAERAGLPSSAVLAGKTGFAEFAALIADAALVVCGDTGAGHLATAYGTPSVLLFGPVSPARWGPPPHRQDRHVVLWSGVESDPFASEPGEGLLRITPAEVIAAATGLLAQTSATL